MSAIQWVPEKTMLGVSLPSGESASDFVEGKPGSLIRLTGHLLGRAALMGVGLYVVGVRGKDLVTYSIAGATAIEVFVLGYAWAKRDEP